MSPVPVMGSVAAELYAANEPLAFDDEANGWALAHLLIAVGLMWQEVADLSEDRPEGPGWSALVDVDRAPANALPWLAQRTGVTLTALASEDVQREEIRRRSGEATGRPASAIAKAQTTLTGMKTVRLLERTSSAYTTTVITRTAETPDPAATLAALLTEKPMGLVLTHLVTDAPLIDEGTRTINAGTAVINTAVLADII